MSTAIRSARVQPFPQNPASKEKPAEVISGPAALARAVSLHLAGKADEALKQLQRAAATDASPEIYRAMGHIQFELGDYQESGNSYRALLKLKPNYAMGWFNLAVCHERLGNWDDASEAFH